MIWTIWGWGQWLPLNPSTSAVWSGSLVSKSIESPGITILFIFMDMRLYLSVFKGLRFVTGNVASNVVAGTIFLLCRRDIVLLVKS